MERDALLAHGTSFLLQDRLMNCSDYSTAWVCRTCGSLISLGFDELKGGRGGSGAAQALGGGGGGGGVMEDGTRREYCRICEKRGEVDRGMAHGEGGVKVENGSGSEGGVGVVARQGGDKNGTMEKGDKGVVKGEMDVIAVPYVFRYVSCFFRFFSFWQRDMRGIIS